MTTEMKKKKRDENPYSAVKGQFLMLKIAATLIIESKNTVSGLLLFDIQPFKFLYIIGKL